METLAIGIVGAMVMLVIAAIREAIKIGMIVCICIYILILICIRGIWND